MKIFVGLENYHNIFSNKLFPSFLFNSFLFVSFITLISFCGGLFLACLVDNVKKMRTVYTTLLLWPFALSPALSSLIWVLLAAPSIGILNPIFELFFSPWKYPSYANQSILMIILAATWKQISVNFIFILSAFSSTDTSIREAAEMDSAGFLSFYRSIMLPLALPTLAFLFFINTLYGFFESFTYIHLISQGGPADQTTSLMYYAYQLGFQSFSIGEGTAVSLILMCFVVTIILIQHKLIYFLRRDR